MKRFALLVSLLLCNGCAFVTATIDIPYQPVSQATPVPGASATTVFVSTTDGRTTYRDRVSSKKNGYGMELAPIVPTVPPTDILTHAFNQELTARGFNMGAGGASIQIELIRFYNDHKLGFFSSDAVANLSFNVRVSGPDGRSVFNKFYQGDGTEANNQYLGADNARAALIKALAAGVNSAMSDPDFIQAIIAAGGKAKLAMASGG